MSEALRAFTALCLMVYLVEGAWFLASYLKRWWRKESLWPWPLIPLLVWLSITHLLHWALP